MNKIIAYLRVSTDTQEVNSQKLEILDYGHKNNLTVSEFIEVHSSAKKSLKNRVLDTLFAKLTPGDTLIIAELSRLARSLGQIIQIVDYLVQQKIRLISIKENIIINPKEQDIQTKVTVTLFGLFAEIEQDLISQRTKAGLQLAREKGKVLGLPKGALGVSKLDGKEELIKEYLAKKVSKSSIAKILEVSRTCLYSFIVSRKID